MKTTPATARDLEAENQANVRAIYDLARKTFGPSAARMVLDLHTGHLAIVCGTAEVQLQPIVDPDHMTVHFPPDRPRDR
jgi:hypothetical protein